MGHIEHDITIYVMLDIQRNSWYHIEESDTIYPSYMEEGMPQLL